MCENSVILFIIFCASLLYIQFRGASDRYRLVVVMFFFTVFLDYSFVLFRMRFHRIIKLFRDYFYINTNCTHRINTYVYDHLVYVKVFNYLFMICMLPLNDFTNVSSSVQISCTVFPQSFSFKWNLLNLDIFRWNFNY